MCAEIIGKPADGTICNKGGFELFKNGLFLERGDYSIYTFMESYV